MNYDEIINAMAKAIYDRQEGLKGPWMPEVPGLCDVYFDCAEAALRVLQDKMPTVEIKQCTGAPHGDIHMDGFILGIYNQLKNLGR